MELYKLLSCTEYEREHKFIKEWQIRISSKLIYVISVVYNQDRTNIVVLLNDCKIEKRIRQRLTLPIIINGIEFIVNFHNQKFTLDVDQQDIEANPVRLINMLDQQQLNQLIAESDYLIEQLRGLQQVNNLEQLTLQVDNLIIKCRNACKQTTVEAYKINLEYRIQELKDQMIELNNRILNPQTTQTKKQNTIKIIEVPPSPKLKQQSEQTQTIVKSIIQEDNTCIICMNNARTHAPYPCGHLNFCEQCIEIVKNNKKCPVCEQQVTNTMKVYK